MDLFGGHSAKSIIKDEIINLDSNRYNNLLKDIIYYEKWITELKEQLKIVKTKPWWKFW